MLLPIVQAALAKAGVSTPGHVHSAFVSTRVPSNNPPGRWDNVPAQTPSTTSQSLRIERLDLESPIYLLLRRRRAASCPTFRLCCAAIARVSSALHASCPRWARYSNRLVPRRKIRKPKRALRHRSMQLAISARRHGRAVAGLSPTSQCQHHPRVLCGECHHPSSITDTHDWSYPLPPPAFFTLSLPD